MFDYFVDTQVGNYMFKFNNKNTRIRFEICSKLTIKTPERRQGPAIIGLIPSSVCSVLQYFTQQ